MKNLTISGRLTKDAELRTTSSGSKVTGFSVAVNDRFTKETTFFDCSFWGIGGEKVSPYLKKGGMIVATGDFGTREYNSKTYLTLNVTSLDLQGGQRNEETSYQPEERFSSQNAGPDTSQEIDDEIPF